MGTRHSHGLPIPLLVLVVALIGSLALVAMPAEASGHRITRIDDCSFGNVEQYVLTVQHGGQTTYHETHAIRFHDDDAPSIEIDGETWTRNGSRFENEDGSRRVSISSSCQDTYAGSGDLICPFGFENGSTCHPRPATDAEGRCSYVGCAEPDRGKSVEQGRLVDATGTALQDLKPAGCFYYVTQTDTYTASTACLTPAEAAHFGITGTPMRTDPTR